MAMLSRFIGAGELPLHMAVPLRKKFALQSSSFAEEEYYDAAKLAAVARREQSSSQPSKSIPQISRV